MRGINIWKWLPLSYSSNLKNKRKEVILKKEKYNFNRKLKELYQGHSLVVQWLGLCPSTAGSLGLIPGQGTKIPQASWCKKQTNPKTILGDIKQDFSLCLTGWPLIILHESALGLGCRGNSETRGAGAEVCEMHLGRAESWSPGFSCHYSHLTLKSLPGIRVLFSFTTAPQKYNKEFVSMMNNGRIKRINDDIMPEYWDSGFISFHSHPIFFRYNTACIIQSKILKMP